MCFLCLFTPLRLPQACSCVSRWDMREADPEQLKNRWSDAFNRTRITLPWIWFVHTVRHWIRPIRWPQERRKHHAAMERFTRLAVKPWIYPASVLTGKDSHSGVFKCGETWVFIYFIWVFFFFLSFWGNQKRCRRGLWHFCSFLCSGLIGAILTSWKVTSCICRHLYIYV